MPVKKINSLHGYRTFRSKKNIKIWTFAQKYSAQEIMRSGLIMVFFSFLDIFLEIKGVMALVLGLLGLILAVVYVWWRTEKALEKKEKSKIRRG